VVSCSRDKFEKKQDLQDRKRQDMQNINHSILINFGKRKVEYKRLHHPDHHAACEHANHFFLDTFIENIVSKYLSLNN